MEGKIQAMSMEAKASAGIIACLPFTVAILVYLSSPDYISLLWKTFHGKVSMIARGGVDGGRRPRDAQDDPVRLLVSDASHEGVERRLSVPSSGLKGQASPLGLPGQVARARGQRPMMDLIFHKLVDRAVPLHLMVAVATAATIITLGMTFVEGDDLARRMRAVSIERESDSRARARAPRQERGSQGLAAPATDRLHEEGRRSLELVELARHRDRQASPRAWRAIAASRPKPPSCSSGLSRRSACSCSRSSMPSS